MPYTFTSEQRDQIDLLFAQGPAAGQAGNFSPMYAYISTVLRTPDGSGNPPDAQLDVLQSRLWFDGATRANAGEGSLSAFIREYTQQQGLLHFGHRFTLPSVVRATKL
jgi:hypothetical protein